MSCPSTHFAVSIGTLKLKPCAPRIMAVLMPTTRPRLSTRGPPPRRSPPRVRPARRPRSPPRSRRRAARARRVGASAPTSVERRVMRSLDAGGTEKPCVRQLSTPCPPVNFSPGVGSLQGAGLAQDERAHPLVHAGRVLPRSAAEQARDQRQEGAEHRARRLELEREALLLPAVVEAAHDLFARHLDDDEALAGETLHYDVPTLRHGVLREASCLVPRARARQGGRQLTTYAYRRRGHRERTWRSRRSTHPAARCWSRSRRRRPPRSSACSRTPGRPSSAGANAPSRSARRACARWRACSARRRSSTRG